MEEKSKFETIKELWNNPRSRSIIILIFWFVFITGVILFLNISSKVSKQVEVPLNPLEEYNNMKSYEFSYKTSNLSLSGSSYNDKYLLYTNNQKFYKNNLLYKVDDILEVVEEPEVLKLDNKMIYNLVQNINPVQNGNYSSYLVPLINFMNTFDNTVYSDYSLNNYNVVINMYEENEKINMVTVDLTNYYKAKGIEVENYILTIRYNNINNVNNFTKEYDEMIGDVK